MLCNREPLVLREYEGKTRDELVASADFHLRHMEEIAGKFRVGLDSDGLDESALPRAVAVLYEARVEMARGLFFLTGDL